jgi:hypothetical protein
MKNVVKLFVAVFAVTLLFSCGGSKSADPKDVADKFLTALYAQDYDKAADYGTEATKQMLGMIKSMGQFSEDQPESFEITSSEVAEDGLTAVIKYTVDGGEDEEKLDMVLQDDVWLVDMKKE